MGDLIQFPQPSVPSGHGFYPPRLAARLARITRARLASWRRQKIVTPSARLTIEGKVYVGYSFTDVVFLRILKVFRDHRVSLPKAARAVAEHLVARFGLPGPRWGDARIYLIEIKGGKEVVVESKDEWEKTVATMGGQKMSELLFDADLIEMSTRADALLVPSEFRQHISIDPTAKSGMPLIRDTAIKTASIYEMRGSGMRYSDIEDAYPFLSGEQIRAAVKFEQLLDAA